MCQDEYRRMIIKQGNGVPTIPVSTDHRNMDWIATDIYEGEQYQDLDTGIVYTRNGTDIIKSGTGSLPLLVDLTASDINDLNTTPFEILPTLAADEYYIIDELIIEYQFGTLAFTAASELQITSGGVVLANIPTSFITGSGATPKKMVHIKGFNSTVTGASTFYPARNVASPIVYLTSANDPTTGDGTIKIKGSYRIETFG